jgi:hypothetical protein
MKFDKNTGELTFHVGMAVDKYIDKERSFDTRTILRYIEREFDVTYKINDIGRELLRLYNEVKWKPFRKNYKLDWMENASTFNLFYPMYIYRVSWKEWFNNLFGKKS